MTLEVHRWLMGFHVISFIACLTLHGCTSHPPQPPTFTPPSAAHSWNLFGQPGDGYYTQVEVGTPPQKFNILVDTGSSNFAIAAVDDEELDSHFKPVLSSSFVDLRKEVKVVYTQGSWRGSLGRDVVVFPELAGVAAPLLTDLVLITTTHNFYVNNSQWQGIVGLAFPVLAEPRGQVQPWLDTVIARNNLTNAFTLELCGPSRKTGPFSHHGRLTIGSAGIGCSSAVVSCPIRRKWFYEVVVSAVSLQGKEIKIPCIEINTYKTIVDSGTSNLCFPPEVHKAVIAELRLQTSEVRPPLPEEFWSGKEEVCWPQDSKVGISQA